MPFKHLEKLDLFHLQLFLAIYQTPNTVQVANRLNISQSAVSRGLAKLRYCFDNQLFVRNQRGLQATHLATELAQQLPFALDHLYQAIQPNDSFNPAHLNESITLAIHPVLLQLLAVDIYQLIAENAPNVTLKIENWAQGSANKILEDEITLGLNYPLNLTTKAYYQKTIHQDTPCVLVGQHHPLAHQTVQIEQLINYDVYSCVVPEFNDHVTMRQQIERMFNLEFRSPLYCADFNTLATLVQRDNGLIAGLSLFAASQQDKLKKLDVDIPLFDTIPVVVYGNQKHKDSPKFQWLEGILKQAINRHLKTTN